MFIQIWLIYLHKHDWHVCTNIIDIFALTRLTRLHHLGTNIHTYSFYTHIPNIIIIGWKIRNIWKCDQSPLLTIRNRLQDVILWENSVKSITRKKIAAEAMPRWLFLFLVMLRTLFSHNITLCSLFLLACTLETKN